MGLAWISTTISSNQNFPLYVVIVIIFCGTFFSALTGIALLKVRKKRRQGVRVLHFITTVPGFLCCATLTCLDAMTVGNVGDVDCSFTASYSCFCGSGLRRSLTPVLVCHQFAIRLVYIVFISLATLCAVICFLVIACWAHNNDRPKGDNQAKTPRRRPRRKRLPPAENFREYISKQYDMMMV